MVTKMVKGNDGGPVGDGSGRGGFTENEKRAKKDSGGHGLGFYFYKLTRVFSSFYRKLTEIFNGVNVLGANEDKNETLRGRLRF